MTIELLEKQLNLLDTAVLSTDGNNPLLSGTAAAPSRNLAPAADHVLFYDFQKHGPVALVETLYLYDDGSFERVKNGSK